MAVGMYFVCRMHVKCMIMGVLCCLMHVKCMHDVLLGCIMHIKLTYNAYVHENTSIMRGCMAVGMYFVCKMHVNA